MSAKVREWYQDIFEMLFVQFPKDLWWSMKELAEFIKTLAAVLFCWALLAGFVLLCLWGLLEVFTAPPSSEVIVIHRSDLWWILGLLFVLPALVADRK